MPLLSALKTILRKRKIILFIIITLFILPFIFSFSQTLLTLKNLKSLQIPSASTHAKKAIFLPKILNTITFQSLPALNTWESGLNQVILSEKLLEEGSEYFSATLQPASLPDTTSDFPQTLKIFNQNLTFLLEEIDKSWLAKKLLPADLLNHTDNLKTLNSELTTLTEHFLTGQKKFIILLQNSQEIRATGGFMGSYANLELDNGTIKNLKIEDIYQPDGQFTGYIEAPTGVAEYLSGGNGWRLPDSNWSPDFPTSAQNILNFFAQGGENNIDGLIALNLTVAENMLMILGDISIPDYNITVTSNNLAEVARSNRDHFFPGSQQKPNFLNALLKQVMIRSQDLTPEGKKQILSQFLTEIPNKNIQFYSNQKKIQKIYNKYRLTGLLTKNSSTRLPDYQITNYLYPLESNVGINKANKNISREVFIELEEKKRTLTINFANKNPNMLYVNYQRLFILPDDQITEINFDDQIIKNWDEEFITSSTGETFKQIGILITVPEKSTNKLVIELTSPQPFSLNPTLVIQKQSGIPATPYTIRYKNKEKNILLEKDEVITF